MQVILQENIKNLGRIGEQVKVKSGFARNYLIPQGKALIASAENLAIVEAKRVSLEKAAAEVLMKAEERAKALNEMSLTIPANVGEEGKLFGSIGTREIEQALAAAGAQVNKSEIDLPDGPLRHTGEYPVLIKLHADLTATITINVVAEETES